MSNAKCPSCNSQRVWKDGIRQTRKGEIQRYICRECGLRFSETSWNGCDESERVERVHTTALYSVRALPFNRQVGVTETQGAENLAEVESRIEKRAAGATKPSEIDAKGKIVEAAWWLQKRGYGEETIKGRISLLRCLVNRGVNIFDPEAVKEFLAKQSWDEASKRNVVYAYSSFLEMLNLTWEPPTYKPRGKLPFIPLEEEIDQLIASCGKKMSAFLQGLKETGADPGELVAVRWIDVNSKNRTIAINHPVKGHNPRMLPISEKALGMLQRLPKNSERAFGNVTTASMHKNFYPQRKMAARKLMNPRLLEINFTTLRHWKGTLEYHKTKDPYHVKKMLGHKSLLSTEVYINLEQACFPPVSDEFITKVATKIEEACKLIEVGFEKHDEFNGVHIYRKRK